MAVVFSVDFHQACLGLLLISTIRGVLCGTIVQPVGDRVVKPLVGSNVTLSISYSGVTTPKVAWFKGLQSIATWDINSTAPPIIDGPYQGVLMVEKDGSLSFTNVALEHSGTYEIKVWQVGAVEGKANFTLTVYDKIEGTILHTASENPVEGSDPFTLYYATDKGQAENVQWFFNGTELQHGSRYHISGKNLSIVRPSREDTGQYNVTLRNPFSYGTTTTNVTVLYGPDRPALQVRPTKDFFVVGESLWLSCGAPGEPLPSVSWAFDGHLVPSAGPPGGELHVPHAQTNQTGTYTCTLRNDRTGVESNTSVNITVYESPVGSPVCSVHAADDSSALQYRCLWPGGTPEAQMTFPALNGSMTGIGDLNLTVDDPQELDGWEVSCLAHHPVHQKRCNITASKPADFLSSVYSTVDGEGKLVVIIECLADASPPPTMTWARSGEDVAALIGYEISDNTTQLRISNFNVSIAGLHSYECTATNPLGRHTRSTRLQGPAISDAGFFLNEEKTDITLTWEVPSTSIVTGFDIQMKGPDLSTPSTNRTASLSQRAKNEYRTIMVRPGEARSADVSGLDPMTRYYFRVVPKAGRRDGEPSVQMPIGPGGGLSGPAIAGIAAGIPCSLLVLLLLCLVFPCVLYHKRKNKQARYPVSRAVEKAVTTLSTPHQLLTGGLKMPPDYSNHQPPAIERSVTLPSTVAPPPARMATTV
ncbi:V-set and immunoglobulin domain-containing protein 10-like [Engraulis encrasicolus]|uniref:V-set and immunoglobulin domain-containing protein 10-like n=1 Tax=Engraulis encrasicolus TaxID=184585 RepID=UPI002FD456DE